MHTIITGRASVTTSISGRDKIGIVYIVDEFGNILTDESGNKLYVSQTDTQITGRPQILRGDSMPVIEYGYWDDTRLWDDMKLWNDSISIGTPINGRTII